MNFIKNIYKTFSILKGNISLSKYWNKLYSFFLFELFHSPEKKTESLYKFNNRKKNYEMIEKNIIAII